MALALSWTGYADTPIQLGSFMGGDHTIVLRFMTQYPDPYEAVFVAESGAGTWVFGMDDFSRASGSGGQILLALGSTIWTYPVSLSVGRWHHAALTVSANPSTRRFQVYFDGKQVGDARYLPSSTYAAPTGTLRLGRRTTGQRVQGHTAQFYGLLDDVVVFDRALGGSEIASVAASPQTVGVVGGIHSVALGPSSTGTVPHGAATIVPTTAERDASVDRQHLPLPTAHVPMDLPLPPGEAWKIGQSPFDAGGSHSGFACFAWDLDLADKPPLVEYPDGSNGAPFYASAPGPVRRVLQSGGTGSAVSNFVEITQAPEEMCAYLHLRKDSAAVRPGDDALLGQQLALTGDTGAPPGAIHIHQAVADAPDATPGFVTFPVAFRDYEVRTVGDSWRRVPLGMPRTGEVVRNPPRPTFSSAGSVTATARGPNQLDVLAADTSGQVWRAHWARGTYAKNWDRWRPVLTDIAAPDSPVHVVHRGPDQLDAFIASSQGHVHTGAVDLGAGTGLWGGWWDIRMGLTLPGGHVTGVVRDSTSLHALVVGNDGRVYAAMWDADRADGQWQGWTPVDGRNARPGSRISAARRVSGLLDIFIVGVDGRLHTAAWADDADGGRWEGWWTPPGDARASTNGSVTVISRGSNQLDAFVVHPLGTVYTTAWDLNANDASWQAWRPIPGVTAKSGAAVAAVARTPTAIDIVVVDAAGRVMAAAWEDAVNEGRWQPWRQIGDAVVNPSSAPTIVSRAADKLDVFVRGIFGPPITAAWDGATGSGEWEGWWLVGADW